MANRCQITGKEPSAGNTRSHAMNACKRRFIPNLVVKKVRDPKTGRMKRMKICTKALKSLDKKMC